MATIEDPQKPLTVTQVLVDEDSDTQNHSSTQSDRQIDSDIENDNSKPLGSSRALWGWLVLCFSIGPTNGMVAQYVTAAIQSAANSLGTIPGTDKPCPRRATNGIQCVVRFGAGEINYVSYLLYLQAISRAVEGVVSFITAGVADYSTNRKIALMASTYFFGILALPFAGLSGGSYRDLNAMAGLYTTLTAVSGVYTVIVASYIPLFMRSAGWFSKRGTVDEHGKPNAIWTKGTKVSVLGLVSSNAGALLGLLLGVIITYAAGNFVLRGYFNYLLAITISGILTIFIGALGHYLLPQIRGVKRPPGSNIILLPFASWFNIFRAMHRYPNPFKMCIGMILWNTGYSNFLRLLGPLFLETIGLDSGSGLYTVWSFCVPLFACIGSLTWMFVFPKLRLHIKIWAYIFLVTQFIVVLWGTFGVSKNVPIGYKHQAEFWVGLVLFMSTGSALRALNRVLYASIIPKGSEAVFFGLDIVLELATGWINPLVQAVIQNRTGNLRFPMIPNAIVIALAVLFYVWTNVAKGIEDARTPIEEINKKEDVTKD